MRTISIGRSGLLSCGSANDLGVLRSHFDRHHYVRLSEFLEAGLLGLIQRQIDRGEFHEKVHQGIGSNKELCISGNEGLGVLLFLMNDEKLFSLIQEITQCEQIGCFQGRIYRFSPDHGHHDSWHNDLGEHRVVGLSINLGRQAYTGGILQIRERRSGKIVSEISNVRAGGAVIFRLSEDFEHRITEVQGSTSKTAFAGWFRSEPDFLSLLKGHRIREEGTSLVQQYHSVSEPTTRTAHD